MENINKTPLQKLKDLARKVEKGGFKVENKDGNLDKDFLKNKYARLIKKMYFADEYDIVFMKPGDTNWVALSDRSISENLLFLNPEIQNIDFEKLEPITFWEDDWIDKSRAEVMKEVISKYSERMFFPGIEYMTWCAENPDKVPDALKQDVNYLFLGSLFSVEENYYQVPVLKYYADEAVFECMAGAPVTRGILKDAYQVVAFAKK